MPVDATKWTEKDANQALVQYVDSSLDRVKATAQRDREVAVIQQKYHPAIDRATAEMEVIQLQLEQFYHSHKPAAGRSIELAAGTIGMQLSSNPALVPLNEKWTWKRIEAKLRRAFKTKFFHAPKPPAIDKIKVKREMPAEDLKKYGMKLETSESFYIDLKALEKAA